MLVVSDATPLNVLIRIHLAHLLPQLYGQVVIPPAVEAELTHESTPLLIREWLSARPEWLTVKTPGRVELSTVSGAGEREAIALASELNADFLLVDDKEARTAARRLGLRITGTLGILELAAARGIIKLEPAVQLLTGVGFLIHPSIIEKALNRDRERRQHG